MRGFVSAHSRSRLINIQWTLSRCRLKNHHRNSFQRWRLDSEELTAPVDSPKVKKKMKSVPTWKSSPKHHSKVTRGFGRADSPCWLRKSKQKRSRCRLGNHHRNIFHRWRVDSEELAAPSQRKRSQCRLGNHHRKTFQRWRADSEVLTAPVDKEKVNETTSKGDAWIRQRPQLESTHKYSMNTKSLSTQKSPPKLLSKVKPGFRRADSPCWLRKS